ncbi:unnamed protein product [Rhizoctonia solani]|uniref:Uncharacterized protein n=1 Tax=Rhizoctonia solani TaxID=456999 RepID=A0A8H3DRI1_9AGAM|nr:unnamed protein product [Rhizoctonia solani]CAE6534413.1 unnamed protein product [Rhizoctonia solani]
MQSDQETSRGLNILCIDGGGVRGVSCLIILKEVMNCVALKADRTVHPHEYFDFIAGAGTGGISACMLGRLRMPIDKAMSEYAKLMKEVFKEKKMTGPTMYKGTKLQGALKTMVREATGDEEEMMSEFEDIEHIACKTIVFAKLNHTHTIVDSPVLFRSYAVTTNPGPDCTIWEASYATMALPNLFKSIIVKSSVNQSFVGGELGYCNPIAHVLLEVHQIYPDRQIASIISIGAGHTRTIQAPSSNSRHFGKYLIAAIKDITIDSEKVAEEMEGRFEGTSGVYFRFNVEQGLQNMKYGSWEMLGDATQHTRAYLQKRQTSRKVEDAARASMERRGSISTKYATGETLRAVSVTKRLTGFKSCPAPTKFYTGNEDENTQVIACINGEMEKLCVCVVYGLGGVGKTQLVLKVVERTWKNWDHIIYVDASSTEVIENALGEFGTAKKIGEGHKEAISWLESCGERWLVVFDNVDTPSTNIQQYIPRSARGRGGSVIIITRLPDLASLADGPGSVCHLSSMSQADATALLVKIASSGDPCPSDDDIKAAETLVQDFGCLPLAIVHAGAYIAYLPGMTITESRSLFLTQRRRMLEAYNELPITAKLDQRGETVYTTWRMCYDQLKPKSRQLLWLIAYLHHDGISVDIFKRAAREMLTKTYPLPLTDLESQAYSHVKQYLSTFLDSDGNWDTIKFTEVMADLKSYSLIEFDQMNLTYRMHVLVHDWAKTVVPQTAELAIECAATLLSLSIDLEEDAESLAFKRQLGLHVTSALTNSPYIGTNHKNYFGKVYHHTSQWSQPVKPIQHPSILVETSTGNLEQSTLEDAPISTKMHAARELHTWGKCIHPNVLQLYGLVVFRGRIGMVSPWMGRGSLPHYLERTPGVDRCHLCAQIGDGLSYLHHIGIIHGDLKGANVLVSDDGSPVLTDFGNSMYLDKSMKFTETTSSSSLTVRWSAAELITGSGAHSKASDVYALAMTIYEVLAGTLPYDELREHTIIYLVVTERKPPKRPWSIPAGKEVGDRLWNLLLRCWSFESEKRPSANEVTEVMKTITPSSLSPILNKTLESESL